MEQGEKGKSESWGVNKDYLAQDLSSIPSDESPYSLILRIFISEIEWADY